jgi:hypothetical protein
MTHAPGRPGGESTDAPSEGGPPADGATDAPHPEEPAEGDRAESAQDAP